MSPDAKSTPKRSKSSTSTPSKGFSEEEKAAMRDYIKEKAAAARRGPKGEVDLEPEVLAKIGEMAPASRAIAQRIHAIVKSNAPGLKCRLWYGMPAYTKDGEVLCYFQPAEKFKARYSLLGFSDESKLDDGRVWPVVFAVTELTPADEARIATLVRQATS